MAPLPSAFLGTLQDLSKRYYYYDDSYYTFPIGAIVGIVIVCIVFFLLLVMICVRRSRRRNAGAVPYQPQPYHNNNLAGGGAYGAPGPYNNGTYHGVYMVPSQYAAPQTELGQMPKNGADANGPISQAPPVYSGPGTFYQSHGAQDQSNIVR